MFKLKFLLVYQLLLLSSASWGSVKIQIVYPREGDCIMIGAGDSTFIYGTVSPSQATFQINGSAVPLNPDGTFLAFVPVLPDTFDFHCTAFFNRDTTRSRRTVFISPFPASLSPDSLVINDDSMLPGKNLQLCAHDLLRVSFQGTPDCRAFFTIPGLCQNIPMVESCEDMAYYWGENIFVRQRRERDNQVCGLYSGCLSLPSVILNGKQAVTFTLCDGRGDTVSSSARGLVEIMNDSIPTVVELRPDISVLRTAPNRGYSTFLPAGVRLWITGCTGDELRVRLSHSEEAWVQESDIRMLPRGTMPPHGIVQIIRTQQREHATRVQVLTGVRVPYRIVQHVEPASFEIYFYGISSDNDWVRFDSRDTVIRDIQWDQPEPEVYRIRIMLRQKQLWGYHPFYDQEDHFNIDIKRAPSPARWPHSPLKGLTFVIDPGHSPDTGAVGPSGFMEKTANLLLASELSHRLENKGAFVYLTREEEQGITLSSRAELSALSKADFTLSLHHNALPDGINPFLNHGSSTYYYHPQSARLARLIQEKLLRKLKLLDFGVYFDNLAMCRISEMPAVLLEPAFIMHPQEEALIKTDAYRRRCANAVIDALEAYMKRCRE